MNNIGISYIFHLCITPNHFLIPMIYSGVSYFFDLPNIFGFLPLRA